MGGIPFTQVVSHPGHNGGMGTISLHPPSDRCPRGSVRSIQFRHKKLCLPLTSPTTRCAETSAVARLAPDSKRACRKTGRECCGHASVQELQKVLPYLNL